MSTSDENAACITSSQFVVVKVYNENDKLINFAIQHQDSLGNFVVCAKRLVNTKVINVGDRMRVTLRLHPEGATTRDRLYCVKASLILSNISGNPTVTAHDNVNDVDALRKQEIDQLFDGAYRPNDDLGIRVQKIVQDRGTIIFNEDDKRSTDHKYDGNILHDFMPNLSQPPPSFKSTKSKSPLFDLPIDRSRLHKYGSNRSRTKITRWSRQQLPKTMTNYRFVIVGPVDDAGGSCMHAYSSQLGHAVVNIAEFSEELQIGIWFMADVETIEEEVLEPIIWRVTKATIIGVPLDQWGNDVRIVKQINGDCIMECYGIVTHFTGDHRVSIFSDVLYTMRSADAVSPTGTVCGMSIEGIHKSQCVKVHARFNLHYSDHSWTVFSMWPTNTLEMKSNVLITTDNMNITRSNVSGEHLHIASPTFGEHRVFSKFVFGHSIEAAMGNGTDGRIRASFAPATVFSKDGWRIVRATRHTMIAGSHSTGGPSQLPHLPMNMIDTLNQPLKNAEFCRNNIGAIVAEQLKLQHKLEPLSEKNRKESPTGLSERLKLLRKEATKTWSTDEIHPELPTQVTWASTSDSTTQTISPSPVDTAVQTGEQDCDGIRCSRTKLLNDIKEIVSSSPEVLSAITLINAQVVIDILNS